MDIEFFGGNCIKIITKSQSIVVDDNLDQIGAKSIIEANDVALFTQQRLMGKKVKSKFTIDSPGEFEVSGLSVFGFSAKAQTDHDSEKSATIYKILDNNRTIIVLGHVDNNLSDKQLEEIGITDILIIPVGGGGFTLGATDAAKIVRQIEPKVVIPTHFNSDKLNFEVPQEDLSLFVSEMGIEPVEMDSFKSKNFEFGEKTTLSILKQK